MRIKLLSRPTQIVDRIPNEQWQIGVCYDVGPDVAAALLGQGWAEVVLESDGPPVSRPPPSTATQSGPLVLVVDDDPTLRHVTASLLTSHGYRVVAACHGQDAIQQLQEQCPSLIILDLEMPVMDGWHFRTEQRYLPDRTRAAIPIVVLSGADDLSQTGELEAIAIIEKPFDPDDLLAAVSAAIGSQRPGPDGIQSGRPARRVRT